VATVSAGSVVIAAGHILAAAIASDPDVVEDLFGISRNQKRESGLTNREHRIRAAVDLAAEVGNLVEAEWIA
jgi:hypothetical protein